MILPNGIDTDECPIADLRRYADKVYALSERAIGYAFDTDDGLSKHMLDRGVQLSRLYKVLASEISHRLDDPRSEFAGAIRRSYTGMFNHPSIE